MLEFLENLLNDKIFTICYHAVASIGISVWMYDGWQAFAYFFVSMAIMTAVDKLLIYLRER